METRRQIYIGRFKLLTLLLQYATHSSYTPSYLAYSPPAKRNKDLAFKIQMSGLQQELPLPPKILIKSYI